MVEVVETKKSVCCRAERVQRGQKKEGNVVLRGRRNGREAKTKENRRLEIPTKFQAREIGEGGGSE